jgi:hypothetical protein
MTNSLPTKGLLVLSPQVLVDWVSLTLPRGSQTGSEHSGRSMEGRRKSPRQNRRPLRLGRASVVNIPAKPAEEHGQGSDWAETESTWCAECPDTSTLSWPRLSFKLLRQKVAEPQVTGRRAPC